MNDEEEALLAEDREQFKALQRALHYSKKEATKLRAENERLRARLLLETAAFEMCCADADRLAEYREAVTPMRGRWGAHCEEL